MLITRLNDTERDAALARLPGWSLRDDGLAIMRTFKFADFAEAFGFMARVGSSPGAALRQTAQGTRLAGSRPASSASSPSSTSVPMALRTCRVALPRWGSSTTFSSAR